MPTTVAIVEDNAGICQELEDIIAGARDLTCVCVCRNAEAALAAIPAAKPEVIVMDIHLPDGSGIQCTAQLRRLLPETEILMFTIYDDPGHIVKALQAGATGYLLKDSPREEIRMAIRGVRERAAPMSRDVARKLVEAFYEPARNDATESLTPREHEVLELLSNGLLYKEIGTRLDISMDTVNTHIKNIYRKLQVRTRTEALLKMRR